MATKTFRALCKGCKRVETLSLDGEVTMHVDPEKHPEIIAEYRDIYLCTGAECKHTTAYTKAELPKELFEEVKTEN